MLIFDIGANVGKYSISNYNKCDKIIAIEADPNTFSKLQNNISQYPKITAINKCVSKIKDQIDFLSCDVDTISTTNKEWLTSEKSRFYNYANYKIIQINTITIDELVKIYGIPNLIKIDVEGGEFDAISSMSTKYETIICFEWASELKDVIFDSLEYLEKIGYNYYSIQLKDDYLFFPSEWSNISIVKSFIEKTIPKHDWGMIWCK
jgi:FkbM family methyltransferase